MRIETYTLTVPDMTCNANAVKEAVLWALEIDGVIPSADELSERYAVVIAKRGWFGRALDKVLGLTKDEFSYEVMKVMRPAKER